jgi:hypothetical protein
MLCPHHHDLCTRALSERALAVRLAYENLIPVVWIEPILVIPA